MSGSVLQSGVVTPGHLAVWDGNGIVIDGGAPGGQGGPFLPLAGGTMLGNIVLVGDATTALEPVTLEQMNAAIGIGGPFLPLVGGTITANSTTAAMALKILPVNNGPTYSNGLLVQQPINAGGLAIGHGATGYLASVQLGSETFHDHFAILFNTPIRPNGQFNVLESVLTIPGSNASANLTTSFTASVHDLGGHGALAATFYALAGASNSVIWAQNSVCSDRNGSNPLAPIPTNVRQQIENDYFITDPSNTVRGTLNILSAVNIDNSTSPPTLTPLTPNTAVSWICFSVGLFPNSGAWNIGFSSGNGGANVALLAGTTVVGNPTTTGNQSQPIVFNYTDNTTGTVQHEAKIYADPTLTGSIGTDLRFTGDGIAPLSARVHPTIDNLASIKAISADGSSSLKLMTLNGQNQLQLGDDVSRILMRTTGGASAEFIASNAPAFNDVQIQGNANGLPPQIISHVSQGGTDTDVGLNINTTGAGVLALQTGGSQTAIGGALSVATAITLLNTSGPSITAGPGVPSSTQPKGSIYLRDLGGVGSTLYVSQGGGTWNAVAGV